MTREELHNEAYEYCERRKDEFIRVINYMEIAYPREKRIEELEKENKTLKDREDGFKKQIIGLCAKYYQVYERFPELKDAFLQGDRIMQENEQLKQQIELYKEMLNRNPCVRNPDWHCKDCLEENEQLKAQIEKLKEGKQYV